MARLPVLSFARNASIFFLVLVLILAGFTNSVAQHRALGVEFMRGSLIEHTAIIPEGLLNYKPNTGVKINFVKQTDGSEKWEQLYNYPDLGYSLIYWDYNNPLMGQSIGFLPSISFRLNKNPDKKGALKLITGFGLGYHTTIYDEQENPDNQMLGSRFSLAVNLELIYQYRISNSVSLFAGGAFTHFSNAATQKPNLGTNMTSLNLGFHYHLDKEKIEYQTFEEAFERKPVRFGVQLASGFQESYPRPRGKTGFWNAGIFASKRVSFKSEVTVGTEVFFTYAIRKDLEALNIDEDFKRVGVYIGHEFILDRTSIVMHLGYHVYRPYESFGKRYTRIGLKYRFTDHLHASFTVKAFSSKFSKAAAEAGEFGIGYTF